MKTRNRKGAEMSINMIVVIAMAVFVVFLIIGFVTGGWSYFANLFGGISRYSGEDAAAAKCQSWAAQYKAAGSPNISTGNAWYNRLCTARYDIDINSNGEVASTPLDDTVDSGDAYECKILLGTSEFNSANCP